VRPGKLWRTWRTTALVVVVAIPTALAAIAKQRRNNATSTLLFTGSPIAFSPRFKMPKAKHTLPPRIASTFPNPNCTSRAHVFQNVQKHISQKPDCMAYAQVRGINIGY
jgi:hypothetical protein